MNHFLGGSISWQPVSLNLTNTTTVTIDLQQTYSWSYYLYPCVPISGPPNDRLVCLAGCTGLTGNYVKGPCVSYDFGLNVTTSQNHKSVTYPLGAQRILAYQDVQWIQLVSGNQPWSLATYINLAVRSDNGRINSSPVTSMAPFIIVPVNTQQIFRIPMTDIDFDIVKCRWANSTAQVASTTIDECGGVCQDIPGAELYSTSNTDNNCTLIFNTSVVGYYVVAIQIEDFMPSAPNSTALSSIPLQFLVQVIQLSCDLPNITGQLTNGDTIQVYATKTFSIPIIAQTGCSDTTINRFLTIILPAGMASTSTVIALNLTVYSTTLTWTPSMDQIGTIQLYCTIAIDSNSLQSGEYCLNFLVIAPTTTTSTSTSSSSTSTTTTITTTTASTTTPVKESMNLTLLLGLILGLGLPLCLLLSLLSCCYCCPRWCAQSCWGKIRRKFWQEEENTCQVCRSRHVYRVAKTKATNNECSRRYHEQYINPDDSFQLASASPRPFTRHFFTSNVLSPFELSSLTATTTTTLLSPVSSAITPTDYAASVISLPENRNNGSHLINVYSQQKTVDEYF